MPRRPVVGEPRMRGHKHPLEIFRESGRAFQTRDEGAQAGAAHEGLAEASRRGLKGAYLERARELVSGNRGAHVTSPSDVAAQKRKAAPARERAAVEAAPAEPERGEQETEAAPGRSAVSRAVETARRDWAAKGAGAGGMGAWSLRSVAVLLTALVLFVGGAYAFRFWPFAPNSASGEGSTPLQRFERWRIPSERAGDGVTGSETAAADPAGRDAASAAGGTRSGTESAPAPADVEFWVLAGSEKLNDARRKDWKQRWGLERQRLAKAFGADFAEKFPGMKIQLCAADRQESEALLRIGPATSEQDAQLLKVLAEVRGLGGSFAKAYVKKFKK
ncbi:MAG: hypothetical protein JNL90_19400 [Planctomycetes bacterium]|nr:hypothetical protein [Planctomycetota bacterium]